MNQSNCYSVSVFTMQNLHLEYVIKMNCSKRRKRKLIPCSDLGRTKGEIN